MRDNRISFSHLERVSFRMREAGVPSDTRIVLSLFILRIAPICTRYPPATVIQTAVALYAVKVNISVFFPQYVVGIYGLPWDQISHFFIHRVSETPLSLRTFVSQDRRIKSFGTRCPFRLCSNKPFGIDGYDETR